MGSMEEKRDSRETTIRRWVMFCVGCCAAGWSLTIVCINIYALELRATYKYSQLQLELLVGFGHIGQCLSLPTGAILKKFGPNKTAALGHLATLGYLLMWASSFSVEYHHKHFGLFALYTLLAGAGCGAMLVIVISSNLVNFGREVHGMVNASIQTSVGIGHVIIILVYYVGFTVEKNSILVGYNLGGFFLWMGVMYGVLNTLMMIFNGYFPPKDGTTEHEVEIDGRSRGDPSLEQCEVTPIVENSTTKKVPGWRVIFDPLFESLFWVYAIVTAFKTTIVVNITSILKSFHLQQYALVATLLSPVVMLVMQPVIGVVSDYLMERWRVPRSIHIMFWVVLVAIANVFQIWYAYLIWYLLLALALGDIAAACGFTLIPPLMLNFFGDGNFGVKMGALVVGYSLMTMVIAIVFGVVYENHIEAPFTDYCYGLPCYRDIYVLYICAYLIAAGLTIVILYGEFKRPMHNRKVDPKQRVNLSTSFSI